MDLASPDYYNIFMDLMDYFIQDEGWKQEYAHQVLEKQCSDIGLELKRRKDGLPEKAVMVVTRKIANEGLDFFKENALGKDYLALVDRLCSILSPYKTEEKVQKMRQRLKRIINRYFSK